VLACEVAETFTVALLAIRVGAVYSPLALTAPQAVPLQPVPEMLQVTAVLVEPVTVAVNCCV
jgi:hypothetical protein